MAGSAFVDILIAMVMTTQVRTPAQPPQRSALTSRSDAQVEDGHHRH